MTLKPTWKRGITETPEPSRKWHLFRATGGRAAYCGQTMDMYALTEKHESPDAILRCYKCIRRARHG